MAVASKASEAVTLEEFDKFLKEYQTTKDAQAKWEERVEAQLHHLSTRPAGERVIQISANPQLLSKDDMMYTGGGGVAGGVAAYVGSTQGYWALTPVNVGIGIASGAVVGYAAGRLLRPR